MQELLRSNDLVLLSFVTHLLDEAGITNIMFDVHTSAIEGSIGILPRRLMVNDDEVNVAKSILRNASTTFPAA